jgi:microcompartment protein CcmK/EutM
VQLGEVVGTVVATRKDPKLVGLKFLIVRNVDVDLKPLGGHAVAVDSVGAGPGDVVLHVAGSSARMTEVTNDRPVDAVIMAIVDAVDVDGVTTYEKHRDRAPAG